MQTILVRISRISLQNRLKGFLILRNEAGIAIEQMLQDLLGKRSRYAQIILAAIELGAFETCWADIKDSVVGAICFQLDVHGLNKPNHTCLGSGIYSSARCGHPSANAAHHTSIKTVIFEDAIIENAKDFDRGYSIHSQHFLDLCSMVELEISHTTNTCRHHKQLNVLIGSEGIELIFVKIEKVAVIVVVCILVEHPVIWARPVAYLEIIASLYKSFTDGKPNPVTAANYYCFF